jgi:hypothetical protein
MLGFWPTGGHRGPPLQLSLPEPLYFCGKAIGVRTLNTAAIAEKFQTMLDVIVSEQGKVGDMFDVIVNDARKLCANAGKLEAKPD